MSTKRRLAELARVLGFHPPEADLYPDVECEEIYTLVFDGEREVPPRWRCWNIHTGEPVEPTGAIKRAVLARWKAVPGSRRFALDWETLCGPESPEAER